MVVYDVSTSSSSSIIYSVKLLRCWDVNEVALFLKVGNSKNSVGPSTYIMSSMLSSLSKSKLKQGFFIPFNVGGC
jgi:hypothetical protein